MNKENDGFKIYSFQNNNIIEFYLTSINNKIFILELDDNLAVEKLKFDKIHLKKLFIYSLKNEISNRFYNLNEFFKIISNLIENIPY